MIYGYCRISTEKQSITRQVKNIITYNQKAEIIEEVYTGTSTKRPNWLKLKKKLIEGDTVIFDSVSRMSRNAKEGIKEYETLREKGINLVFIKEGYINTEVFNNQLKGYENIETTEDNLKPLFEGIKETLKNLAREQIVIAFNQSEKEVQDMKQRTREGLREAKARGSQVGRVKGTTLTTKRGKAIYEALKKHSRAFGGNMTDKEFMELYKCSKKTLIKYKRQLRGEKE